MENSPLTRKTRKRFLLNIQEELHQEIKIRAAKKNISITTYIIRALYDRIKRETMYEKSHEMETEK